MAQSCDKLPPCDWLSVENCFGRRTSYPNPSHLFINMATRNHDTPNFASGLFPLKCDGEEIVREKKEEYDFNIPRSTDFMGHFALAILLPKEKTCTSSKILKSVSLYHKELTFRLSGEENYQKAVSEGLWPWKTNGDNSRYFLIPLMFPGYIHNGSTKLHGSRITIQLEEVPDGDIQMIVTGFATLLHNDLRVNLSENIINKLVDISIDDFAPNIKYQQPDKNEIMRFTDEPLKHEYKLSFSNDCKAFAVEISCDDPELMNKSLPVKHLEIYWNNTLAIHAHAVDAREYYWKLAKIPVPHRTSFLLPLSLDLVTPHAASIVLSRLDSASLCLNIHPDWKDAKVDITIISIGHASYDDNVNKTLSK